MPSIDYTYDPESQSWYFGDSQVEVCRTEPVKDAVVNIDWSHYGTVVGIEILTGPKADKFVPDSETVQAVVDFARGLRYSANSAREFWTRVGDHFGVDIYGDRKS